jgi:hypothetical protein
MAPCKLLTKSDSIRWILRGPKSEKKIILVCFTKPLFLFATEFDLSE